MKCNKCGETILTTVSKCPNCGSSLSISDTPDKTGSEQALQPFEEQELVLSDEDFGHTDIEDSTTVHDNPWEAKEQQSSVDEKSGSNDQGSTEQESSLDKTRDLDYENKIKSIPADEYDIICKGIKETFVTNRDISKKCLKVLKHHKFTEFEIHKLVMSLFEEMEESGSIQKDKLPDWLLTNTVFTPEAATSGVSEKEKSVSDKSTEKTTNLKITTKSRAHSTRPKKRSKENDEALDCLREFEQEATYSAANGKSVQIGHHSHKRNPVMYSNLRPKRRKRKVAMVLILMALLILLYPTLENIISPDVTEEKGALEGSKQRAAKNEASSDSVPEDGSVKPQTEEQNKTSDSDYSEYFDYFDSVAAEESANTPQTKENKIATVSDNLNNTFDSTGVEATTPKKDETLATTLDSVDNRVALAETDSATPKEKDTLVTVPDSINNRIDSGE